MRHRTLSTLTLLLCTLLWLVPDAHARGGRAPAAPGAPGKPVSDREPGPVTTPPQGGGGGNPLPPGHDPNCGAPLPGEPADPDRNNPDPPLRGSQGGGGSPGGSSGAGTGSRRGVRAAPKRPGLADWSYWYDANREEFEDLRRAALLTESNPLFALGGVGGDRVGRVSRRLDDPSVHALRTAVAGVLADDSKHWVYTEGAAYVALGKIATDAAEVERIIKALAKETGATRFVRESAALGLGQLRRTETRRHLAGTTLDRARAALEAALRDDTAAPRTRAFAAVSLGLLSDQPSSDATVGRNTAAVLARLWTTTDLPDDVQVGILVALGLHRPEDIGSLARLSLKSCMLRGTLGSRACSALIRAHAALALARIGSESDAPAFVALLEAKRDRTPVLAQAGAIAAGVYGSRFASMRPSIAKALFDAKSRVKDPGGRAMAVMAVGRLMAADVADGSDTLLRSSKAASALLAGTRDGNPDERSFAALALGLAVRSVDEQVESDKQQDLRVEAIETLRKGFADKSLHGHARAAFATALGLARDDLSRDVLLKALADDGNDPELRAHSALALGLIGRARADVIRAVAEAMKDARSDNLRTRATTALGLLGGGKKEDRERTIDILIEQLRATRNQYVKGQIAITLARIGDARAVKPLVAMLETSAEPHLNRSLACAALGLLGDEERTPVLSEARRDSHYMSGSGVVFDLLDVL